MSDHSPHAGADPANTTPTRYSLGDKFHKNGMEHTVMACADGIPLLTTALPITGLHDSATREIHTFDLTGKLKSIRVEKLAKTDKGESVHLGGDKLEYGTSDGKGGLVPPPIAGRRKLSPYELQLLSRIKEIGVMVQVLEAEITHHLHNGRDEAISRIRDPLSTPEQVATAKAEADRIYAAAPFRHLELGRNAFEDFAMRFSRAVAQPSTYA